MQQYIEVLEKYFTRELPEFSHCEMKTLLGRLYCCYSQDKKGDSQRVKAGFEKQEVLLRKLSVQEQEQLVDITCDLCSDYQQEAFEQGLLTGFRLFAELKDK